MSGMLRLLHWKNLISICKSHESERFEFWLPTNVCDIFLSLFFFSLLSLPLSLFPFPIDQSNRFSLCKHGSTNERDRWIMTPSKSEMIKRRFFVSHIPVNWSTVGSLSQSWQTTFQLEYEMDSHFDGHTLNQRPNEGVTTLSPFFSLEIKFNFLFVFVLRSHQWLNQHLIECCKSIICYQCLSLTFLRCSNIYFDFSLHEDQ